MGATTSRKVPNNWSYNFQLYFFLLYYRSSNSLFSYVSRLKITQYSTSKFLKYRFILDLYPKSSLESSYRYDLLDLWKYLIYNLLLQWLSLLKPKVESIVNRSYTNDKEGRYLFLNAHCVLVISVTES